MRVFAPLAAGYLGLVILANWLASAYVVHVPLTPYAAPAGVFAIGAILVLRDWMQQLRGLRWTMPLVYAAGLISWLVGDLAGWTALQKIAVASVVAFTASETVEAVVFTPLRKRSLTLGVALSGTVGLALDIELVWIRELGWIVIGRSRPGQHNLIGRNMLPSQFDICSGMTEKEPDRWQVAEHLLYRCGHQSRLTLQTFQCLGVISKA